MIDLNTKQLETIKRILKILETDYEVWAYGSRVKGDAGKYSDLDLVVKGDGAVKQDVLFRLKNEFEISDLPFRVDILDWNRISDEFRKQILENYTVILPADNKDTN